MKVLTGVKTMLAAAVAAAGLVAFAEPVVEITKAWQATPGSGTIDFTYEVRDLEGVGTWAYDLVVRVGAKDCENTFTFTNENVSVGSVTTNIDYKAMLGDVYQNVSIYASLEKRPGGVQLWAGGPYFASCNVGATKPEEYGYYFWWGDTVGYVRNANNNGWVSSQDGTTTISFYSTDKQAAQTSGKTLEDLKNDGWIDAESGNLKPAHDAATKYYGPSWRMPTKEELHRLFDTSYCTGTYVKTNGVDGFVFTGLNEYAGKSIFMPCAGYGHQSTHRNPSSGSTPPKMGDYWTSTPDASEATKAHRIYFDSSSTIVITSYGRTYGFPVRPVHTTP